MKVGSAFRRLTFACSWRWTFAWAFAAAEPRSRLFVPVGPVERGLDEAHSAITRSGRGQAVEHVEDRIARRARVVALRQVHDVVEIPADRAGTELGVSWARRRRASRGRDQGGEDDACQDE